MTCQPEHTYGPGADDYLVVQAEAEIGRSNDEEPQPPQHTKTESLAIAAEDFIADVDSLLVAISDISVSHFTDIVEDSMTRLQQAVKAMEGEKDAKV
jgi:hypothetical protein